MNPIFVDKKRVLLRSPVLTQSGYGVHARQVAKWLMSRQDFDVQVQALPWGDTPWLIDKNSLGGFIGQLMEKTVDPSGQRYDASVQLQLPNEWDPKLAKVNIGITAGVETDKCNPDWVAACNSMTMVIVPSRHAEQCFRNTGEVRVPIHVVPEAFSEAITKSSVTVVDDVKFSTPFNFLVFGQLTGNNPENDRKNIFYTIKWICETFKNDEDVGVVVKSNAGRNTKIDKKLMEQTLSGLLKETRKGQFPRVNLVHGDMSDEEVASLYRHPQIKALVTLTRGEGYGLPILEAAASGLPVVATGWSGHTDFLSRGKYIEIGYKLDTIHSSRVDNKIFMKDSKWAHPLEDDFKRKLTKFRTAPVIPGEWAADLKKKIHDNYSMESVVKLYNEVTKDIL